MDLIIYVPRIEASMPILRNMLMMVVKRYKALSLPLPREFCRLAVLNPREAIELLMRFGNSFVRLWGWVPGFLRDVMVFEPSASIECYDSMDRLRRSIDFGVDLAGLIIRYRLSGRVDYDDWLRLFSREVATASLTLPDQPVVVVDDYVQFMEHVARSSGVVLLGPLVPTPIDLMVLISSGKLGIDYLAKVVDYVINYIGDYVVMGRDLTDAFIRLISDREYVNFVRSTGLPIIT
ncbi:hypothetical protein [Vulcanisaeta sp. JCM 14467]